MPLKQRERHMVIITYLKEIKKTEKVFESKWKKGQLITRQMLKSIPVSSYCKYKWKQKEIEQLFVRAQCSMTHEFEASMHQFFAAKSKPKLTKTRKSFRAKKRLKRKSESDLNPVQISKISKLYHDDKETLTISPLYESSPFTARKKKTKSKTLLKQSESMAPKNSRNKNKVSIFKMNTDDAKYQANNPYLDTSVLSDNAADEGMEISPLSAQKILEQMPWKNMEELGMSMECKIIIKRDKDTVTAKLEKENKRLMDRIKEIEKQLQQQRKTNDIIGNNGNDVRYNFDGFEDNIIILRSECNNKPLMAKSGKLEAAKGFIGFEIYTKWKMIKCTNGTYKLQQYNDDNGNGDGQNMFIRMLENGDIDVKGNGSQHCAFRAHLVTNANVILFESVLFPNKYLASNKNGNVYAYNCEDDLTIMDNKECMFQVLTIQNNTIISVRRVDNGKIFALLMDLNNNILSLKTMIHKKESVPITKQILYFQDTQLIDNKTLIAYNIHNSDIIDLQLKIAKTYTTSSSGSGSSDDLNDAKESQDDADEEVSSSDDYDDPSEPDTVSSSEESTESDIDDEPKHENDDDYKHEDGEEEDVPHIDGATSPKSTKSAGTTSKFDMCVNEMDGHNGGISCIACSPTDYTVITGGEHDRSLRIWKPKKVERSDGKLLSEIRFVPIHKANVDGTVFSVSMSDDGALIAAGCSWRKSQNGYVVVWNMSSGGGILCDLRSKKSGIGGQVKRRRHARSVSMTLAKDLMQSTNRVSATKVFEIKRTDSVHSLRFGVVHCVKLMKFKSKKSKRMNYLLFGGDTTGCVLCWNLSLKNKQVPICRINAGSDVIYDLAIINNKYLFSVSHDKTMRYCNIKGLRKKKPISGDVGDEKEEKSKFEAIDTMQIYKDPEYALHSVALNLNIKKKFELVFGSRKCRQFEMNQLVVIRHKFNKYLSVTRGLRRKFELTGNGKADQLWHKTTKWNIEYLDGDKIRLRSRKSGKYLRMSRNGTCVDVLGEGASSEHESIFRWKAMEKTLQSHKYPKYFMAVQKEANSNCIMSIKKEEVNENVSIEFELFDSNTLNTFKSFFNYIYEPPQDLDRICNLKVRHKLLIVQRKDINHIKVFNLSDGQSVDKSTLLKRFKIAQCECSNIIASKTKHEKSNICNKKKADQDEDKHVFRIYDCGISFNQKYAILCVGIFVKNNLKKAVSFSLKGFKIPSSPKKPSSFKFCPQ